MDEGEEQKVTKTMASSYNEPKANPEMFKTLKVLGKGSFGDVYLVERVKAESEASDPHDLG